MFRACLRGGNIGQVDLGLHHGREFDLCLFRGFLHPVDRHLVAPEVDAFRLLELGGNPFVDGIVHVRAAQLGIPGCGKHGERAAAELHDGDIKGTAAEIEDQDLVFPAAVKAVGHGSRGGLIDQPDHIEAGDLPGILGCRPLVVVEIGRDRDDGLRHFLPKERFRVPLDLLQEECRDLLGRVLLPVDFVHVAGPHLPFGCSHRPVRVGHGLPPCRFPDQQLAVRGKRYIRREHLPGHGCPFCGGDDGRFSADHDRSLAVRCPQINADNFFLTH